MDSVNYSLVKDQKSQIYNHQIWKRYEKRKLTSEERKERDYSRKLEHHRAVVPKVGATAPQGALARFGKKKGGDWGAVREQGGDRK